MPNAVSPLAPKLFPELPPIAGVRFATAEAGIRYRGRTDALLMALDAGTTVAGVLTRSLCPSAAVDWCRTQLAGGLARGLLVNSGNANAFTGRKGREAVVLSARYAAAALGCGAAASISARPSASANWKASHHCASSGSAWPLRARRLRKS